MSGVDNDWVPADPGGRRVFTAMREGSYLFQVRAVAETGRASEPTGFHFEIAPPWWRSTPAALAALFLGAGVIYGVFRYREHTLRRRNAELEEKVRTRTVELELASAAKTQFVANMSHDIRNPLNGIVGLTLALDDTPLDARQRELVSTLRECTAYLATLVDDVLDFASIEAGRVELRPGPFAPAELLRSIAATLRAEVAQSGAAFVIETSPNLPATVTGDAGRIQQILINYAGNALKYAGGRIVLSAHVPPGAPGEIEFAVTDSGPGISEADQARLFSKFTRLAQQPGAQIEGTGLGLASCKLLADLMDGSVGVESQPGQGSRFTLRLPLAAAVEAPLLPVATATLPPATVLLVEDTDYNAWAANAVLAKLGLTATRAHTGAEALELFATQRFNIVLLDRNLPDLDGTEVARRMRALEENGQHALLLAVTAYCTAEDRELCLKSGMDAFVGKPLTPEKLRRALLGTGRQLLAAASVQEPPGLRSPAFDLTLLGYLSDGTPQGLEAQVARFLGVLAEAAQQLQVSAADNDFHALADTAHGVLSQARLIGCTALSEAAVDLEQAARAKRPDAVGELLARVRVEIDVVTAALRHPPRALNSE
ncbi:MAG: response regulator [Verrucomicrobia bacterium]|nr:response regulator [Verrucomicrobiota bacterium]